jgi:Ca2+-transporting ATPase
LFTAKNLALSLLQGFVVLAVILVVFIGAPNRGFGEAQVRTLTFTTIVIANLALILTNRSWSRTILETLRTPNRALTWVFAGTLGALVLVLEVPVLRDLFRFAPVPFMDLALCAGAGGLSVFWFEIYKYWNNVRRNEG